MFTVPPPVQEPALPPRRRGRMFLCLLAVVVLLALATLFLYQLSRPPVTFPVDTAITIDEGSSIRDTVRSLHEAGFVRSAFLLYVVLITQYEPRDIKASTYVFSEPLTVFAVAERLVRGDYSANLIRFVHLEGESNRRLAERATELLDEFDPIKFAALTEGREGQLFPDTYLIPRTFTTEELVGLLTDTYEQKLRPLRTTIAAHPLSEDEVITLASILEREANTPESKKMVSGILQNRLRIGMALQADASIEYVLDKPLSELTPEDLDIESPYNTYLNPGLPPTPIGNPGLDAIRAVLEPTPSPYLFYITGNDGNFYYAETYEEHRANIARYLR